jgi:hypothetical protein
MIKLPLWARVALMFANLIVFCILLLGNKLDSLFPFFIYPVSLIVAWLNCGLSYELLPGKKAIEATKAQMGNTYRTEPGAPNARERAIGYWAWFACWIVAAIGLTAAYHGQYAGYY